MITQQSITQLLLEFKSLLDERSLDFFIQATQEEKLINISKARLEAIKNEITEDGRMNKNDFVEQFPKIFQRYLERITKQSNDIIPNFNPQCPKKLPELFLITYYAYQAPCIDKHDILRKIAENVNTKIHHFFQHNTDSLKKIYDMQQQMLACPIESQKPVQKQTSKADPLQQDFSSCLCRSSSTVNAALKLSAIYSCQICLKQFHGLCFRLQSKVKPGYICPFCTIHNMDPLNPVVEVLVGPRLLEFADSVNQKYIPFVVPERVKQQHIEIRCLKLDGKDGLDEISWPDKGHLVFNKEYVASFKPMSANTSLKKRKDEKFTTNSRIYYNEKNEFIIAEEKATAQEKQELRIFQYQPCIISVYAVDVLTPIQLIEKVKSTESNYLAIEKCIDLIRQSVQTRQDNELQVESVTYSLQCQIDLNLIETPVRTNLCTHVQCFSLENYIKMNTLKQRKWRCPLCKLKSFFFIIDSYWVKIIKVIRDHNLTINQIQFNQDGLLDNADIQKFLQQDLNSAPQKLFEHSYIPKNKKQKKVISLDEELQNQNETNEARSQNEDNRENEEVETPLKKMPCIQQQFDIKQQFDMPSLKQQEEHQSKQEIRPYEPIQIDDD